MKLEMPVEYGKGYTKFLDCKIDLSKRVFIPRVETEFWVRKTVKDLRFKNRDLILESPVVEKQRARKGERQKPKMSGAGVGGLLVLDIFAGSGCIGIAILKDVKKSFVDFVDIDEKAIFQIKINLKLNKIPKDRYKIYKSNLFEKVKNKKYDVIFANPPYVAKERIKEVQPSVLKYEPKRAILAGKRGMYYIKKFLKEAKEFLKQNGIIYLEFDPLQKNEIKKILEKDYNPPTALPQKRAPRYKKFQFFKDQFRKFRYAKIWFRI